jgi:hypothetical protein
MTPVPAAAAKNTKNAAARICDFLPISPFFSKQRKSEHAFLVRTASISIIDI